MSPPTSDTTSARLSQASICLTLAEQVLAITREITALRHRVRVLEHQIARRGTGVDLARAIGLMRAWAKFLASPRGQALLAIVSPLIAALAKWLMGGS